MSPIEITSANYVNRTGLHNEEEDNFQNDPYTCSVCLDRFDRDFKPPKILSCGHSFCEGCLFSLCLHREYYLLDTVQCPKCENTFDAQYVMKAPINLDLCNLLEQTQSSQNITVIHVDGDQTSRPEGGEPKVMSRFERSRTSLSTIPETTTNLKSQGTVSSIPNTTSSSSNTSTSVEFVIDLQDSCQFCFDCRRYVSVQERPVLCRFCARCHGKSRKVRLSCLECCVNIHNGHQLRPIEELEREQDRLVDDLRLLEAQTHKFTQLFESRLNMFWNSPSDAQNSEESSEFISLDRTRKLITTELATFIQKAYSQIDKELLLHPNEVHRLRKSPFVLLARLQRLANLLEQACRSAVPDQTNQEVDYSIELKQTLQALCTLTVLQSSTITGSEKEGSAFEDIRQYIILLCSKECSTETRADVLKSCVRALSSVLYGLKRTELLLLYEDAYLNAFVLMNLMSPRRFGVLNPLRDQIWRLIQVAYSELLRIGNSQWPSINENRIQIVSDFARLCSLFGDVCDSASITLCVLEAAKVRAAIIALPPNERFGAAETQLQQIDEHLHEIRRVQKLAKICVRSRLKPRRQSVNWLSCFFPGVR